METRIKDYVSFRRKKKQKIIIIEKQLSYDKQVNKRGLVREYFYRIKK